MLHSKFHSSYSRLRKYCVNIKASAFCGLSHSEDWQKWLLATAPDLYQGLIDVLNSGKGCRANSNKMMDIYFELSKRDLSQEFDTFINRRYPWLIEGSKAEKPKPGLKPKAKIPVKSPLVSDTHKVFKSYRPDLLTFPQKLIIVGEPTTLYTQVMNFTRNKLAVDYLIVDDHAYIEYFESKYSSVIDRIPRESREIYQYRLKNAQNDPSR